MLHEGASKSSSYERLEGLGNVVVSHTPLGKGDVLFLISSLEEEFKIKVSEKEIRKIATIGDVTEVIERLVK